MASMLMSFAGWAVIPDFATQNGLFMIHTYIFPLLSLVPPPRNTQKYQQHYRWLYSAVILGYLSYTLAKGARQVQPNFYEILGVLPGADENGLKLAFRNFAKRYHPDRVGRQGEALFIAVRDAFEALKNPTVRFAYDRFGPEVLQWQNLSTPREYMRRGLMASSGYHLFSGIALAVISSIGRPSSVKFWRYLLYWSLLCLELSFILYPTPTPYDISFKNMFHLAFPHRVPYQHITFLHQVFVFFGIALTRVAPRLFPDDSRSEYEIMMQHLSKLTAFADSEASVILHSEFHAARPDLSESDISPSNLRPFGFSGEVVDELAKEMENMIIETQLLQPNAPPPLQRARDAAIERGRSGKEENKDNDTRKALSKALNGTLPSPRPSPPPPPGLGSRKASYVRARSLSC